MACLIVLSVCSAANAQVPEIPNPNLPDIARVVPTPAGPVIEYNPIYCQQLGPLVCAFYRAHEYGHVNLGHGYRPAWPQQMEAEADCWAARNSPREVVMAAHDFFMRGGGSTPVHGSGPMRASRLRQCAN
jgi:hypothetical protein